MDEWSPTSDAMPSIKLIGEMHRRSGVQLARKSTYAEDEEHRTDERGDEWETKPTSNLKGRPKIKMQGARM